MEIRRYQKNTEMLLRKAPMLRIIREIGEPFYVRKPWEPNNANWLWQSKAIEILQEAAQAFLVQLMEDANLAAIHANRVTIKPKDFALVRKIGRDPILSQFYKGK